MDSSRKRQGAKGFPRVVKRAARESIFYKTRKHVRCFDGIPVSINIQLSINKMATVHKDAVRLRCRMPSLENASREQFHNSAVIDQIDNQD